MSDEEVVRGIIEPLLEGVDEPILEYLATLIAEEEGGPTRDLSEDVAPYLLSAGIEGVEDEDAANALCERLQGLLRAKFGGGGGDAAAASPPAAADGPTLLNGPINMAEATQVTENLGWGDVFGKTDAKGSYNDTWETKDLGKAKRERKALKALQLKRKPDPPAEAQMTQLTRMMLPTYDDSSGVKDVQVDSITLYTPAGSVLLEDAKLRLTYGRRYGLIGKNGIGKTTLLKAIAAQEIDGFPKHLRCLHVSQECGSSEMRVIDAVMDSDVELQTLLATEKELLEQTEGAEGEEDGKAKESAELSSRLLEVQERLDEIDAKSADSRARTLLSGLQFSEEMQNAPLSNMSGGWRVRAAIAAALFIRPEILMLDEPTNHLDLEAVLWLESHLQNYPHTVLVVSHDRAFLNEVVTDILAVDNKQLKNYKGDYDTYEKTKKELLANQIKEYDRFLAERKHMQDFVDTFRYNAKRASLVQSRIKAIEKLEAEAPPEPIDAIPFTFSIPSPDSAPGRALIQLEACGFEYPARGEAPPRMIFSGVDFSIDSGEKVGIVGPNGAGKSTMLKLFLGELEPTHGGCRRKPGVSVASFTQHHVDKLDLGLSPVENLQLVFPGTLEAAARSWIGGYGIQGEMQTTPCKSMSGGQKSRVAFALLAYARPNLIVMDEPTNHLDLETIDALIEALRSFSGGVVVVTHDQHFVERVCKELWVVGGGRVKKFGGQFIDYKKEVLRDLKI